MRTLNAIAELIEAKAELIREEAAVVGLGTYSRAYKEGRDDLMEQVEVVYIGGEDDDPEE